jgi:hypothetical protein
MEPEQKAALMQFFKAVGQPDRLRMLGLLANNSYTLPELAQEMGMKETAVSRSLRTLKKAGLIEEGGSANTPIYQLNGTRLNDLHSIIEGESSQPTLQQRVMEQYIQGETLTAIPQREEERQIILQWLADKFDLQRRYTEEEVTAVVAKHYPYPLTLRRILADSHFLLHTGRHYWRPLPDRVYK